VPDSFVGAVMSDLSGRRGRVLGTEPDVAGADKSLVRAEVPATELVRYAVELRAMTSGSGTFSRKFVRHDPMPPHLAEAVRKEHAERH
jgi:elongation factor G